MAKREWKEKKYAVWKLVQRWCRSYEKNTTHQTRHSSCYGSRTSQVEASSDGPNHHKASPQDQEGGEDEDPQTEEEACQSPAEETSAKAEVSRQLCLKARLAPDYKRRHTSENHQSAIDTGRARHSMEEDSVPSELSLFDEPPLTAPYQKVQYIEYRSSSALNDSGPLQFFIPPTANQFIDLRRSRLHLEARIVGADGLPADAAAGNVAPVNLTLQSMFGLVEVQLQQQLVSSNQLYPYKAYMETILHHDENAEGTYLKSQGFYKDTAAFIDVSDGKGATQEGLFQRWAYWKAGKVVDLEGPILADICQQDRHMLNGVEISFKLWPSKQTFNLMCPTENPDFHIELLDAYLSVCKVTPEPSITMGISKALQERPALFPYTRSEMRSFHLQEGQYSFHLEDMYQQAVPKEIIVGMVSANGFNGNYKENPFNFQHFNIETLAVYVDDESIPAKPLKMDFKNKKYISAYNTLFGAVPEDRHNISRADYNSGYTLFRFRLTPEQADAAPPTKGNVKLVGTFKEALKKNVTLIVMGKVNSILTIDNARTITI